jgi:cell division protease FtsH
MLNEAALLAARRNGRKIRMDEIEAAVTKVIAGPAKKSRVISDDERRLTAYHEAGHAIVARVLPNTDPVHQITIIPRGRAGGFTMILPKEDKYYTTKTKMMENIVHLLGGRVAEKLTLNDISTGASNDISRATEIARDMVTKYGFSDRIGPVNYSSADEVFLGKDFSTRKNYSEEMASEIDEEVRNMIEAAYVTAENILSEHAGQLDIIANALLEAETLDGGQFEDLFTGKLTPEQLLEKIEHDEKHIREKNAKEAAETEKLLSLPKGEAEEEEEAEGEESAGEEGAEEEAGGSERSGARHEYREYSASGKLRKSLRMKVKRLSRDGVPERTPDAETGEGDDDGKGHAE